MEDRGNWVEIPQEDALVNCDFIWKPVNFTFSMYDMINKRCDKEPCQLVINHFEVIRGIATKTGLIRTLKSYYKNNTLAVKENYKVFDTTPTTFLLS